MTFEPRSLAMALILTGCSSTPASTESKAELLFRFSSETGTSYESASGLARRGGDYPPLVSGVKECIDELKSNESEKLTSVLKASALFSKPNPPTVDELPYCDLSAPTSWLSISWKGRERTLHNDGCNPIADLDVWNAFESVAIEKVERCR